MPQTTARGFARRGTVGTAAALAIVVALPSAAHAHHRIGTEPTMPYAQPATPPMRGCQTVATPSAPTGSPNAIQVIYAWHSGDGNNYEASVEQIARIVDRIDWMLDASSNYDQHLQLSCRYTPNGTYADYARALVVPEQIEAGSNPFTSSGTVRNDLAAAGYNDPNRWYLVLTDFESESDASLPLCTTSGGCSAVAELWDSGVVGHELLHTLGAGHAWMTENGEGFCPDVMTCWGDWWLADGGFNTYYDPSETGASFYIDPYPSTATWNIARSPALTVPVCCDSGASSDRLTAQERTVDGDTTAPGGAPTGFNAQGSATVSVTPSCGRSGVSCRYFDGRKSLQVTTNATAAESGFAVVRRPDVTAGASYKFYVRLRSDAARTVKLQFNWYNSTGGSAGSHAQLKTLTTNWIEHSYQVTAPTNATNVRIRVVTDTTQSSFTFHADSLQLSRCSEGCRANF